MTNDYDAKLTADRIKEIAKSKKITISQLNSICDFSENTIKNAGKSSDGMKAKNLFMIAEVLGCSVDYLLGRTDSLNVDNSIKTGNVTGINVKGNTSVNIGSSKEQDITELVEMVQDLPLVKRAKVITYIDEIKKEE